jgi:type II secretory pathway component PulF
MDAREEAVRGVRQAGEADGLVSHALERMEHARPRERDPRFSARGLTVTGLTLLGIFIALEMLIVPRVAEFYSWFGAPLPAAAEMAMNLGRGMQRAWLAVVAAFAFLSWMLLRRPTRAAGLVLILFSLMLIFGMLILLSAPAAFVQQIR